MFKKTTLSPTSAGPKWGLEPKKAASGGKMAPQGPGAGYTGVKGPSREGAKYPTRPAKGGK